MEKIKKFFIDEERVRPTGEPGQMTRTILARGGSLMMVEAGFRAGDEGAEHAHPHEQVSYCLAGEFDFFVDGETQRIGAGDSVYIPSSALHGAVCIVDGCLLDVFSPQRTDFL